MKVTVTSLIVLALFSLNSLAQEYTQWYLPEGAKLRLGKGEITEIEYSPDGSTLAVATSIGIWLYNTVNYKEAMLFGGQIQEIRTIAYAADGSVLVSGSYHGGGVRLWDAATGEQIPAPGADYRHVSNLAVSSDGSVLAIASSPHGLELRDSKTGAHLRSLEDYTSGITSLAFSPDGNMLARGGHDRIVRILDTLTGDELRAFEGREYGIARVAFNPHDGSLVIGRVDYLVEFWDPESWDNFRTLEKTTWPLVFNSNGSQLATGTFSGAINVRKPETGAHLYTLSGHTAPVVSMAFSADDQKLASASEDGSARIWDVKTASQEHVVSEHFVQLNYLAFSPDADTIVTNASRGVHLFDAQMAALSPRRYPLTRGLLC